jgi:hypothetical protein
VPLQEFAITTEQLTLQVLVRLPQDFVHNEAAYAFVDRIKD